MSSPPPSAPFVGRTRELARLGGYLDEAMGGAGRSCFVTGEPGTGKSTLIAEFGLLARKRYPDLFLAVGDCNPQTGTDDAYLPFREIMTRLTTGGQGAESAADEAATESRLLSTAARLMVDYGPDLIDLLVPGGAVMTRLGGEVAARLRRRRSADRDAGPGTQSHLGQAQLMEQYTNVVRAVAETHPLLLVVDDLHWADEASISLLFHLVRRIGDRRVLILGAFRANEIAAGRGDSRHPLEAPLNEIRRYQGDVEVALPSGQADSGRQFIDQLLDAEANELDESFRDELFRRTGGHALFTVELLHHLREGGLLARNTNDAWTLTGDLAWDGLPVRVEGVIGERAARLAVEENELLTAASVLGESFDAEVLAEMTGRPPRDVTRSLSGALSRKHALVRARGFHYLAGRRLAEYEFRHNLVHAFFYGALDRVERGMLHEDAARAIEALVGTDCAEAAVTLGRHFSLADIPDRAAHYLTLSGREALRSFAHREAKAHFERALDMLDRAREQRLGDAEWSKVLRRDTLAQLGEVLVLQGDFESARACFERALDLAGGEIIAHVRLLAQIAVSHERQHHHHRALVVLDEALRELDAAGIGERPELRDAWLSIQVQKLWLYYWQGDIEGMERTIAETGPTIETHGTRHHRQRFYAGRAALGNRLDHFLPGPETVQASEKALAVALVSDTIHEQADGLFGTAFILLWADDFERARTNMERALELTRRCGNRTHEARVLTYLAILHRRLGDRQRVKDYLAQSMPLSSELGMSEYIAAGFACQSWLAWGEGDGKAAGRLADRALDEWREHAPRYPFKWLALIQQLALALEAEGVSNRALEMVRELLDPGCARLCSGVSEALEAALATDAEGASDQASDMLREVVNRSRSAGYL